MQLNLFPNEAVSKPIPTNTKGCSDLDAQASNLGVGGSNPSGRTILLACGLSESECCLINPQLPHKLCGERWLLTGSP